MGSDPWQALAGLVDRIHAARTMAVLAVTGGGAGAIAALLRRPGGSRTVLEAHVPYSAPALAAYLGGAPAAACAPATAAAMARTAFQRATALRGDDAVPVVGLGATAALTTDRVRRGDERVHVATFDGARLAAADLILAKGARDRAAEEALADGLILRQLAGALGIRAELPAALSVPDRLVEAEHFDVDPITLAQDGVQPWLTVYPDGRVRPGGVAPAGLVSGSFNPLHQGHLALFAAIARRVTGLVAYELSVTNVDKPPLPVEQVRWRIAQFAGQASIVLTRAPTFLAKARLLPGAVFAVGVDTAERIIAPRYYGGAETMDAALAEVRRLGNRFCVAGRVIDGRFTQLDDLAVPAAFRDLFEAIPPDEVQVDVSSSELRVRGQGVVGSN